MYASTWICTKQEDVARPKNDRAISALSIGSAVDVVRRRSVAAEEEDL